MKTKNFPSRKLRRQIIAKPGAHADLRPEFAKQIEAAATIRTKKNRGPKS